MKNLAVLAVIVGLVGGNTAVAETGISKKPTMILALNSITAAHWVAPKVESVDTDAVAKQVELQLSEQMQDLSAALDKQLEEKLAKDLVYDVQ